MFVLVAAGTAANDFVPLRGAKVIALRVLIAFAATMVVTLATGSAPLSSLRGVQPRRSFPPRAYAVIAVLGGAAGWLIARHGAAFTDHLGGFLYGAVFTGLFALSQRLTVGR